MRTFTCDKCGKEIYKDSFVGIQHEIKPVFVSLSANDKYFFDLCKNCIGDLKVYLGINRTKL